MLNPDDWTGAVAIITRGAEMTARPVAHVFLSDGALTWVEPSYAAPAGPATSAVHAATDAVITQTGIKCRRGEMAVDIVPYDPEDHRDLIGDALDWYGDWLKTERRPWKVERDRVQAAMNAA